MTIYGGCARTPFASEKIVIFSAPTGFRGPIVFSVEPSHAALPIVQRSEITYSVPVGGMVEVKSMDLSNGALWENYMVRYPDGSSVKSYGFNDPIESETSYLFHLGAHNFQGVTLELFLVSTVEERLKFQSLTGVGREGMLASSAIWIQMHTKGKPNQAVDPTAASGRGSP